jgi:hypothetical protein
MGASFGDLIKNVAAAQQQQKETPVFTPPTGFQRVSAPDIKYTQAMRPGYQEFGPSGQFQQPIYRPSYSGYVQPTSFYAPTYDAGNFYNPFVMEAISNQLTQQVAPTAAPAQSGESSSAATGMASGGGVGIDALLK